MECNGKVSKRKNIIKLKKQRSNVVYSKRGGRLKKVYLYWVITVLLSFFGFYLIETTFTIDPDRISGNGNLGILIIMLFSPIFIAGYLLTFIVTREISHKVEKKIIKIVIVFLLLICCGLLIPPIINYTNELIIALGGTPSDRDSKIYRFGWFNQYTNSIYFNNFTFLLTYLIAAIIGILSGIKRKS